MANKMAPKLSTMKVAKKPSAMKRPAGAETDAEKTKLKIMLNKSWASMTEAEQEVVNTKNDEPHAGGT